MTFNIVKMVNWEIISQYAELGNDEENRQYILSILT
jgi:hypothetical protein